MFRCGLMILLLLVSGLSFSQDNAIKKLIIERKKKMDVVRILDTLSLTPLVVFDTTIYFPHKPLFVPPNFLGKSMMTPTGWGGLGGGVLFAGIGGTYPVIYTTNKPDLISVIGLAAGNPQKSLSGVITLNINDVSKIGVFSANLMLQKHLTKADALAVGGIHLLPPRRSDAPPSYFIVYSHAVQSLVEENSGSSRLHYSVGAGTGRFYEKSQADRIVAGKSLYGTVVFGNISYGIARWLNVNLEWSGINLHTSISFQPLPSVSAFINLGLADLTRYSGERIRFIASIQYGIRLWD